MCDGTVLSLTQVLPPLPLLGSACPTYKLPLTPSPTFNHLSLHLNTLLLLYFSSSLFPSPPIL